jgi:hypothetical protein
MGTTIRHCAANVEAVNILEIYNQRSGEDLPVSGETGTLEELRTKTRSDFWVIGEDAFDLQVYSEEVNLI